MILALASRHLGWQQSRLRRERGEGGSAASPRGAAQVAPFYTADGPSGTPAHND
jgi:hypothetical protein